MSALDTHTHRSRSGVRETEVCFLGNITRCGLYSKHTSHGLNVCIHRVSNTDFLTTIRCLREFCPVCNSRLTCVCSKVKVNCTVVQAPMFYTGPTAHRIVEV